MKMHEWYPPYMDETRKQELGWFSSTTVSVEKYFFFSSIALIILFAWMEPAGAAGLGFWRGLVFWTIQVSILIPLLIATQQWISHYSTCRGAQAPWIQTAISGVLAATLFVPLAYCLDLCFAIPEDEPWAGILPALLEEAAGVIVPVTVTWLALNAPWICQLDFSRRRPEVTAQVGHAEQEQTKSDAGISSRFIRELRSRTSGDLISIRSELHYLHVTTTDSEVMFLYNLKDAIDELPSNSGVQVHRSHWVAREHITKLTKRNGNTECILSNGKSVPVSRRKSSEVKDLLKILR